MIVTPGVRISVTIHGLPSGEVEVLLTAAATVAGTSTPDRLLARNVCRDTPTACRCAVDFLTARMEVAAPEVDF